MPKLLIVESPTKKKHIQEFLGPTYNVQASVGHIRDLPEHALGIDRETLTPVYEVTEGKKSVVNELKRAAYDAEAVILATDPDREGEAISWHIYKQLKLHDYSRVTFNEITERAVKKALENPRKIDENLVKAQETRRIMDRLCGYLVSNKLTTVCHSKSPLSAGRTQSPALRLVVEREREITHFVPKDHFGAKLHFKADEVEWTADFIITPFLPKEEQYLLDKSIAEEASKIKDCTVLSFKDKDQSVAPPAFFTTSTLQQAASASLKIGVKETSALAQKLFENGYITYIRTDNPNISDEFFAEASAWLKSQSIEVVGKRRTYKAKAGAQEAHEAIRPTDISLEKIEGTKNEQALYTLIRKRTIAACMPDAVYAVRECVLDGGKIREKPAHFIGKGRTLKKPGWKSVTDRDLAFDEEEEASTNPIPKLAKDDKCTAISGEVIKKQTKPPTRYDEAGLTRKLEAMEIGRPATFASIISTIEDRGYVTLDKKRKLHPTPIGEKIVDVLMQYFSLIDYDFTKNMEESLDKISEGKETYENSVKKLWSLLDMETEKMMTDKNMRCECPHPDCNGFVLRVESAGKDPFWVCDTCESQGRNKFYEDDNGKPVLPTTAPCPNEGCTAKATRYKMKDKSGYFWVCQTCKDAGRSWYFADKDNLPVPDVTEDCPNPACKGKVTRHKYKNKDGYFWICNLCEMEGREKFYQDNNGKPVYVEKVTAKCPNPDCTGECVRLKKKDKDEYFWICKTCEEAGRNKFYRDMDGKPVAEITEDCPNPKCSGRVTKHKFKDKDGFFWICDTCEKEGRNKFYQDNDGKPTYIERVTAKCPDPKCKGECVRYKKKDKDEYFWICKTCEQAGRNKFYQDKDGKPVKPEIITAKCPVCGSEITRHNKKDGTGAFWTCQNCKFLNDVGGKPETTQKCPSCGKKGLVERKGKTGASYFTCLACKKGFSKTQDGKVGQPFKEKK